MRTRTRHKKQERVRKQGSLDSLPPTHLDAPIDDALRYSLGLLLRSAHPQVIVGAPYHQQAVLGAHSLAHVLDIVHAARRRVLADDELCRRATVEERIVDVAAPAVESREREAEADDGRDVFDKRHLASTNQIRFILTPYFSKR